jgi:hypothetical protein
MVYEWYNSGNTLLATVTGSHLWTPPASDDYYAKVKNTVLTDSGALNRELILESDLFTFVADTTPPVVTLS